jgi:hypothetical protein
MENTAGYENEHIPPREYCLTDNDPLFLFRPTYIYLLDSGRVLPEDNIMEGPPYQTGLSREKCLIALSRLD